MISWAWLIVAFFLGDALGIIAIAICVGSTDKQEERNKKFLVREGLIYPDRLPGNGREKENRQRGNADGSKGGVL